MDFYGRTRNRTQAKSWGNQILGGQTEEGMLPPEFKKEGPVMLGSVI